MSSMRGHDHEALPAAPALAQQGLADHGRVSNGSDEGAHRPPALAGGVAITLRSWMPASAACRVRGIGVAVSVST